MNLDSKDALALIPGTLSGLVCGCFLGFLLGCSGPHDTRIDDAFCQVLAMQFQIEKPAPKLQLPTVELKSTETSQPTITPEEARAIFAQGSTAGASDGSDANEVLPRPAETTAAEAPKPRPLFYEIILHTGDNCPPCEALKQELKTLGYRYREHKVKQGTVPTAFIDGQEFVGNAIYDRLKMRRSK